MGRLHFPQRSRQLAASFQNVKSNAYVAVISDQENLNALAERLKASPWVAIDTEADSLHAYPEKLCLMQVSYPDGDDLIDTLAKLDLTPILRAFENHELIFHGADYDLRLLCRTYCYSPGRIFDTMLAARLLGETQFGLTHLVKKFLGVDLEKGPQKMDWARRPLTPRMEAYARNDTRYLKPLSDLLRAALEAKGRLGWLEESCARLIRDCEQMPKADPDSDWRIRGSDRLEPRALAILRELWKWREKEAILANRPPFFVLSHDAMIEIARIASDPESDFRTAIPRMPILRKKELIQAVHRGREIPEQELPSLRIRTFTRPTAGENERFNKLRDLRDKRAKELGLDPTLIASRGTLGALAKDWNGSSKELMDWQHSLLKP
ncbi:MAG: HRDC domain-containing protein [Verrucomicrobiota bacterium]|nr:HRDC domain-containing protein [Verrucomicrobiota bacterium]